MKKLSSLTVFFPTRNDAQILPYVLTQVYALLPQISDSFEVLVVNDGSTDNTATILNRLQAHYRHLKIINHPHNLGYGAALRSGFSRAASEWVFYTDGDGQYDPGELRNLVNHLLSDTDVINGFKIRRADPLIRRLIGAAYNWFLHRLYPGLPISDIDCDFRLIRRSTLQKIRLTSTSGIICLELVLKLQSVGARFREVGIHHYPRPFGRSQFFRPRQLLATFQEFIKFNRKYQRQISKK